VATRIGVHPTTPINITNPAPLRGMVVGIIVHENGGNPYSTAVIDEGVRHALARAGLCDQVCRPWC